MTVTIKLPEGYATGYEFAEACGFEIVHQQCGVRITDSMVMEACDVYSHICLDDDKDMGDAMREALKAALALSSADRK